MKRQPLWETQCGFRSAFLHCSYILTCICIQEEEALKSLPKTSNSDKSFHSTSFSTPPAHPNPCLGVYSQLANIQMENQEQLSYLCKDLACSVLSNSLRPRGLEPIGRICPWDFPGKNAGVGCQFLLQEIYLTQGSILSFLCLLNYQVNSLPLLPPGKLCIN